MASFEKLPCHSGSSESSSAPRRATAAANAFLPGVSRGGPWSPGAGVFCPIGLPQAWQNVAFSTTAAPQCRQFMDEFLE